MPPRKQVEVSVRITLDIPEDMTIDEAVEAIDNEATEGRGPNIIAVKELTTVLGTPATYEVILAGMVQL